MREYHMKTERIGFSRWMGDDLEPATLLWGDPEVTRYLSASGVFSPEEIRERLYAQVDDYYTYQVQYWPIFLLATGELIGCCGLRPLEAGRYELGFHLRKKFWGQGYAQEAAKAVIEYAFGTLKAYTLRAGHHPENLRSKKLLEKLGFEYKGSELYKPTGIEHPTYELWNPVRPTPGR